ncbi:hypothetical protein FD755_016116 [Muntiacus reevesi]|uniref:MAGE domain-containing protein n=1 Tax=Muntiacus reevesi TaxID=9886 RepID=A0A5N3XGD4_MUNRE|nr:hypothetical protein FD755_016116 [Muntiacus reevesi]
MPRRHNNKYHAHGKRHLVQGDTQCPQEAQNSSPRSFPATGDCQELQGAMAPSFPNAGVSCAGSDEGAQGTEEESAGASQAASATQSTCKDPLTRKVSMLVEFLLEKYPKEPITQHTLLKVNSTGSTSPRFSGEPLSTWSWWRLPKSGLLMMLLGVIFMNGNQATEEEVWEFLSVLGVYAGRRHLIFGEPRRLITKDLVQKKFLNYLQVPNSDPLCYEFLWGPRTCAETIPSAFPDLYDETLRDQAERAGLRSITQAPAMAEASAPSRAKSCSSSHI